MPHQPLPADVFTGPLPAWLKKKIRAIADRCAAGHLRTCHHLSTSPIHCAAAWAPEHLACPACFPLLQPTGAEDTTCDRCRRQDDNLTLSLALFGPLMYAYGLCEFCETTITLED